MWPTALLVLFLAFQNNYYEQGLKALDQNQYQVAVDDFLKAIEAEPQEYTLHFNLALAYSLLGKDVDAIPQYKKVLELKPGLYQADLNLGITLVRSKQPADALPYLAAAVEQKPREYRPNYYLAAALLASDDFPKAEQAYATALTLDPKSPDAELGLAHALSKQNKLTDAAPHFKKAAELNPKYNDGLLELAALYEAQKQPAEAIALYQQFPDNPGAQERLGELLLSSGQPADAVTHFQAAIEKSPTTANRAALAEAYIKNKEPDKALPVTDAILSADPNNFDIRMLHGRILRDQRKFAAAAQDFARATQMKPDYPNPWSELAGVLVMSEDYPAALGALDRLAVLHAEKPGHVYLRAIVLDKIRQVKPALESYQKFLAMSNGQNPDEEFKARQRVRILQREIGR
ncbi:MAG TPA: tetratricopeptide repeat protein [Bryobacteraceae bacterium]|jgi:tetratricopeptide (TPR) repeat protein|nr:tetratricopeptide repeat protein [Bryobacteraceae bacterium]